MPDRELTEKETLKFIHQHPDNVFHALEVFQEEKTKPSLHDLCINELTAIVQGQTRIIIEQGRDIQFLKKKVKELIS